MPDYTRSTGSSGTMMIRDTGTIVEFWLKGASGTFNYDLPWRYTINGVTSSEQSFNFKSGGQYQKLGSWSVSTDQTVSFILGDTNTSGLGGPTTLSVTLNRSSLPAAPNIPTISGLESTTLVASFTTNDDGGLPNTYYLGYGTNPSAPQFVIESDRSTRISGLSPGGTYYIWARAQNAKGYSGYSPRRTVVTHNIPPKPGPVTFSNVTQRSLTAKFSGNGTGGTPILEWQLAYGPNPDVKSTIITSNMNGINDISGLIPGLRYYFWARGRNAVGWSDWSFRTTVATAAGVRYKKEQIWGTAVVYVNVEGVWKPAKPFVKIAGLWKETG